MPPISVGPSSVERSWSFLCCEAHAELAAAALLGGDLEPEVGLPRAPVLGHDRAGADAALGIAVFEHEHVDALAPVGERTAERALRRRDPLGEEGGIRGQVHRVELAREVEQRVRIARLDRPQDQHGEPPRFCDAAQRLLEHREAALELLVGGVHGQEHADLRGRDARAPDEQALLERGLHDRLHHRARAVERHERVHRAEPRVRAHRARHPAPQRLEPAHDALAEHRDPALGAEVALGLEPLDDARAHREAHGRARVGAGDQARFRVVARAEQRGAALQRLAAGDDVDEVLESERAIGEQLARAREGLHLVHPHRDARGAAALHHRAEELRRRGVVAALALDQLEDHARDPARVAPEVRTERLEGPVRVVRVVERDVQHAPRERQSLAIGRLVGDLGERERAPGEVALERDDRVGGRVLLEHELERVLVRDRARDREPAVFDVRSRVAQQRAQQLGVLGGRREVTLVDAVARRGHHGRLEQIGVGVPEEIGADPADEIEHRAPVGQPYARSASARRDQRGYRERAPAQPRYVAQRAFVGLGR